MLRQQASFYVGGIASLMLTSMAVSAAQGELGTGIPKFGTYSAASGMSMYTSVALDDATIPLPSGCPVLIMSPATMGMDSYRISVAILLAAKVSGRKVRFYSHMVRDGGCGVDYVEIQ